GTVAPATITFSVTKAAAVAVGVVDGAGTQVATLAPEHLVPAGPQTLSWDGAGVGDGAYSVVVTARAGAKEVSRRGSIVLDRTLAGLAATPLVSPNGDGRLDALLAGFDLARPASVLVRVL